MDATSTMALTSHNTAIIALLFSSGLLGAFAGGAVSLLSQMMVRRWQLQDNLFQIRKELYAEIAAIGSEFASPETYEKINRDVSKALMICEKGLQAKLMEYMSLVVKLQIAIENLDIKARKLVLDSANPEIFKVHMEILTLMKKELRILN